MKDALGTPVMSLSSPYFTEQRQRHENNDADQEHSCKRVQQVIWEGQWQLIKLINHIVIGDHGHLDNVEADLKINKIIITCLEIYWGSRSDFAQTRPFWEVSKVRCCSAKAPLEYKWNAVKSTKCASAHWMLALLFYVFCWPLSQKVSLTHWRVTCCEAHGESCCRSAHDHRARRCRNTDGAARCPEWPGRLFCIQAPRPEGAPGPSVWDTHPDSGRSVRTARSLPSSSTCFGKFGIFLWQDKREPHLWLGVFFLAMTGFKLRCRAGGDPVAAWCSAPVQSFHRKHARVYAARFKVAPHQ